jgi:ankyrin repeat protein
MADPTPTAASAPDRGTWTDLMSACREHNTERMTELLGDLRRAGRSIDADRSASGGTAMHVAAYHGHAGVVAALADAGACIEARDGRSRTPLMVASSGGHDDVVAVLLALGASAGASDRDGNNALRLADAGRRRRASRLCACGRSHGETGAGNIELALAFASRFRAPKRKRRPGQGLREPAARPRMEPARTGAVVAV